MYLTILIFCFIWILLFTFKPTFTREIRRNKYLPKVNSEANTILVFLYAILLTVISRFLIYFIAKSIACGV